MEKHDEIVKKFEESLSKIFPKELDELVEEIDSMGVGENNIPLEDFFKMVNNVEINNNLRNVQTVKKEKR